MTYSTNLRLWFGIVLLCAGCAGHRQVARREAIAPTPTFHRVPIGIGEDYAAEARTVQGVQRDLQILQTNGLKVLRVSFPWEAIEPEPGRYDWHFWDQLVSLATDRYGIRLIPYVCYTPRWAATDQGKDFWRQPPRDNARFAAFMRRIATRYRGRIHSWEIWNEPDNRDYWLGSVDQFASLLEAGSHAVRQADPTAKVVMGGLAWNLDFLEAMLTNAPALREVDVINLHNYYETWSKDPLERLTDYIGRAHDLLRSHGRRQEIWMAEVGYGSFRRGANVSWGVKAMYDYEHTPEYQAASLFRVLSLLLASGRVSLVTWYRLHDLPPTQEVIGDVNNRYLGVLDASGRPKPALRALTYFRSLFSGGFRSLDPEVRVAERIRSSAEVHAFERPDGKVVVIAWLKTVVPGERWRDQTGRLWDIRRESVDVTLPFAAARTGRVFDERGRPHGRVRVAARPGPGASFRLDLMGGGVAVVVLRSHLLERFNAEDVQPLLQHARG